MRTDATGLPGLHGNDAKQVKVSSNEECLNASVYEAGFPRGFGASVGMTSVVASGVPLASDSVTLRPVGRGYVANKNKMVGAVRERPRGIQREGQVSRRFWSGGPGGGLEFISRHMFFSVR